MADNIAQRIARIRASLPAEGVALVAVSKFHPAEAVAEAYACGQRDFGESRALELEAKAASLPADIRWHFIGHLQTNKVRRIMPHVAMIQSIDSMRLLRLVSDEARRIGRRVDVLLQVHVAREETKFGFLPEELLAELREGVPDGLDGVCIRGVMGMASNTDDAARIEADFRAIRGVFDSLREGPMSAYAGFDTVSMGMSHDYLQAVGCGSTMVRVGSDIFGSRGY